MPKRLPINDLRELANKRDLRQVILMAWDGERTHVVTYGRSVEDCNQAAIGGNKLKEAMNWPKELCDAEPSRVKKLKKEAKGSFRHLIRFMNSMETDRADWDGEELTIYLGTNHEPWGRSEFRPNTIPHKEMTALEIAFHGLKPFVFILEKIPWRATRTSRPC